MLFWPSLWTVSLGTVWLCNLFDVRYSFCAFKRADIKHRSNEQRSIRQNVGDSRNKRSLVRASSERWLSQCRFCIACLGLVSGWRKHWQSMLSIVSAGYMPASSYRFGTTVSTGNLWELSDHFREISHSIAWCVDRHRFVLHRSLYVHLMIGIGPALEQSLVHCRLFGWTALFPWLCREILYSKSRSFGITLSSLSRSCQSYHIDQPSSSQQSKFRLRKLRRSRMTNKWSFRSHSIARFHSIIQNAFITLRSVKAGSNSWAFALYCFLLLGAEVDKEG